MGGYEHLFPLEVAVTIAKETNTSGLSEVTVAFISDVTVSLRDTDLVNWSPSNRRWSRHFPCLQCRSLKSIHMELIRRFSFDMSGNVLYSTATFFSNHLT